MILHTALIAILLQAAPPAAQAPKAAVAGVVLNANGEPIPNIRVALGKLNVNLGAFAQLVAGDRPPREATITAEALAAIAEEIANEVANGGIPPEDAAQAAAFKSIPLADIHEITVSTTGVMVVVPKSSPPVLTDDRGRFAFNEVEPGTYRVMFSGAGYAKQDYGQRTIGSGVPLNLTPGQAKTDIVMRMMTVGALGGRIHDASGQPAAGVPVQLFRFSYDETGKKKVQRVAASRTDDLGDYRMYYLTPGRYYISAGSPPGQNQQIGFPSGLEGLLFGGGYSTQNRIPQNYAVTYFPGVANENAATPIDVPPGADLRGIDLFVSPQQTYRVRGRVIDPRTGQPPQTVSISLAPLAIGDPLSGIGFSTGNPNYKAADGSFELQNVSAGAYTVNASLPGPPQARQPDFNAMSPAERNEYFRAQEAADRTRPKASALVNVNNADVDGVILTLGLSGSIAGRLRVEPNVQNATVSLDFTRVQLKGGTGAENPLIGGPQTRPVTADGTFRIDNVWPGEYRVSIAGLPAGFYLKEGRLGPADVLNQPLRVTGPDSNTLDLVLSPNVGALDGSVVDSAGQAAPGAQVVLIPSRNRDRTELFRPVTSDSSGHFAIPAVSPGEYILAAWEAIEPNAFFDPNLIQQAEGSGKAVRVSESSSQTVNLTTIPASAR